ncbi:ELM1/GtrOC1 family putative glycosyltransferase [Methylopila henanensis]|uniref:ELM1/GtrOC1 family putative glycosyltransferase n=1 Tax=Methylopila henanensis TaxID=873516 RepID=A0ABW4K6X9_9HYPH
MAALTLWALTGRRAGDNRQVLALAEATGLPFATKPLVFSDLRKRAARPEGSIAALDAASRASLAPPWPDLVVAAGRWSAHAALWIRAQSGGRARLVHVGRPWAPLPWFDLVVTTAQYGLPPRPNVLENAFPLSGWRDEAAAVPPDIAALPRPRLLAIVGGDSPPRVLDVDAATALARAALARVGREGGSLLLATSPRTRPEAVAAIRDALADASAPTRLSVFGEEPNFYRAFLAAADAIIVTDDSAAMTAEAAMTGAPVALHPLPQRPSAAQNRVRLLRRLAGLTPPTRSAFDALVARGTITSIRDLDRYAARLRSEGLLDGGSAARERAAAELDEAARRARALVPAQRPA